MVIFGMSVANLDMIDLSQSSTQYLLPPANEVAER